MINLELQYCVARQEANMCQMSADDYRLRLEWQREEIARVNGEKESAIAANLELQREWARACVEADGVGVVRGENERLKGVVGGLEGRVRVVEEEREEMRMELEKARFALRCVPGVMRRLCGRVLVPVGEKGGVLVEEVDVGEEMDGEVDREFVDGEGERDMWVQRQRQRWSKQGRQEHHQCQYGCGEARPAPRIRGHERGKSRSFF